jgi:fructosamine-3-kinase
MPGFQDRRVDLWTEIGREISTATGRHFTIHASRGISGGDINRAFLIEGGGQRYFVKLNEAGRAAMFEAEAAGLEEIAGSGAIRVPHPICWGASGQAAYLVLEHIAMQPLGNTASETLGRQLAGMHRHTATQHGWRRDNTIGSTFQGNAQSRDWVAFWREQRLGFQLGLAARNGFRGNLQHKGERLLASLHQFFPAYAPPPSLLHGDLWGGNCAADQEGGALLFDPAVYYGDRETDLAMTELFGGFPPRFHAAYREAWPLDPGYAVRKTLYNLYHILNHANLFGGAYAGRAEDMIDRLLGEIG